MTDRLVTVATSWENWEAHLASDRLLDAGINCFLSGENFVDTYWLLAGAVRGIKLKVAEPDAPEAALRCCDNLLVNSQNDLKYLVSGQL